MIAAFDGIAVNDAEMEGNLAVGAAILDGEDLSRATAIERDRLAGELSGERFAARQFVRPCGRIPVIPMGADPAQVAGLRGVRFDRQVGSDRRNGFDFHRRILPLPVSWRASYAACLKNQAKNGTGPACGAGKSQRRGASSAFPVRNS